MSSADHDYELDSEYEQKNQSNTSKTANTELISFVGRNKLEIMKLQNTSTKHFNHFIERLEMLKDIGSNVSSLLEADEVDGEQIKELCERGTALEVEAQQHRHKLQEIYDHFLKE